MAVEAMSWSLKVTAKAAIGEAMPRLPEPVLRRRGGGGEERSVYDAAARRRLSYALVDRDALAPGDIVEGPALIIEAQTTTVVTSPFDLSVDAYGNIVLTRKDGA
jgi:N-methylhydantoinase A